MKRALLLLLLGATFAAASGMACAHTDMSFGFYVGTPAYAYPPAPVYYEPAPAYYPPPVFYGPAYYGPVSGVARYHWHHRDWHGHHHRHFKR